eukprot:g10772.t1
MMPLLVEEGLSFDQWETQLSVAKKLMQRVESARRKEYEARKDLQAESEQALAPEQTKAEPQDFESLLMGGPPKAAPSPAPAAPVAPAPPPPANDLTSMGISGFDKPTPSVPSSALIPLAGWSGPLRLLLKAFADSICVVQGGSGSCGGQGAAFGSNGAAMPGVTGGMGGCGGCSTKC